MKLKKMKAIKFLSIMLCLVASMSVAACGDGDDSDEPDGSGGSGSMVSSEIERLSSKLFGTSWQHSQSKYYTTDGRYSHMSSSIVDCVFTFSDEIFGNDKYELKVDGTGNYAYWYINEEGLTFNASNYGYMVLKMDASTVGAWMSCGGCVFDAEIYELTSDRLVVKEMYSNGVDYVLHYYNRASSGSGGSSGGTSSDYEKPDIGFYDFTATKSSLKVQYKIYNQDEANVTSAKIYYGTSSNPTRSKTATVSGQYITATITGLESGTTYYVKCEASGKGGTATTSTTKCITNY